MNGRIQIPLPRQVFLDLSQQTKNDLINALMQHNHQSEANTLRDWELTGPVEVPATAAFSNIEQPQKPDWDWDYETES